MGDAGCGSNGAEGWKGVVSRAKRRLGRVQKGAGSDRGQLVMSAALHDDISKTKSFNVVNSSFETHERSLEGPDLRTSLDTQSIIERRRSSLCLIRSRSPVFIRNNQAVVRPQEFSL